MEGLVVHESGMNKDRPKMTPRFLTWETLLIVILLTWIQMEDQVLRKMSGFFKLSCNTRELDMHLILTSRFIWRRKWQPTPVFLPEESQGWRSLVGCRLRRGRTGSDMTEET